MNGENKKTKNGYKACRRKVALVLFSMMVPGLIYIIINNYIPMAGLIIAFKRYDFSLGAWESPWAGLANFTYLFRTKDALNIIRNTVLYNLTFIVVGTVVAVTIAIMLNSLRGKLNKKIFQTVILIPFLISMVVVSYIGYAFMSQEAGYINSLLTLMGGNTISWYTQPKYWPAILVIVYLWKNFGYMSILYYATVIGIDTALYEAAAVDGANAWKQIVHVTLPGLKNTVITLVLLSVGRMFFSDFGLFYQVPMRSGILANVTDTIDVYVYKGLMQLNDIGRASAAGFLQSILGFVLILTVNMIVRKIDKESALF